MTPQSIDNAKIITNRWEAVANDLHRIINELPRVYPSPQYVDECGDATTIFPQWHGASAGILQDQLVETRSHIDSIVAAARRAIHEAEERHHTPERVAAAVAVAERNAKAQQREDLKREAKQIPLAELAIAYTEHGYPYPSSDGSHIPSQPDLMARCGGPALCPKCAVEAGWGAMAPGNYVSPNAHELAALHVHDTEW